MPTYDYECQSCGNIFEYFQSINDDLLKSCPECGKTVKRLIGGGTGIIFKGSGFYVTDSKKPSCSSKTGDCPAKCPAADSKPSKTTA